MPQIPKAGRITGLVLHILIGGMMIAAGSFKLIASMPPEVIEQMAKMGIDDKLKLIGAGEIISAVLLIVPVTCSFGVLMTSGFWGGVICIHMSHKEPFMQWAVMLLLTWLGAFLRYPGMFSSFFAPRSAATE